jgi:formamidopyrimidine-DNA glycosylase
MPELPEVETIRRSLEAKIKGKTFTGAEVFLEKIIRGISPGDLDEKLSGRKITGIERRGKYIIIRLTGDVCMVVHLRMTGQLFYCLPEQEKVKHTHVVFHLSDKAELRFADQRQFGKIQLTAIKELDQVSGLKDLGVEPLSGAFTREFFKKGLRKRRTKIKPLLLDQTFVAGIGNIYADEALFRARINPARIAAILSPREASKLYLAIREVLLEGVENNGTSIKDYVDGEGNQGSNQDNLRVYGREGQACSKCGKTIERKVIAGRSAHFCPKCQKL